jgi:hypothetical protein
VPIHVIWCIVDVVVVITAMWVDGVLETNIGSTIFVSQGIESQFFLGKVMVAMDGFHIKN